MESSEECNKTDNSNASFNATLSEIQCLPDTEKMFEAKLIPRNSLEHESCNESSEDIEELSEILIKAPRKHKKTRTGKPIIAPTQTMSEPNLNKCRKILEHQTEIITDDITDDV